MHAAEIIGNLREQDFVLRADGDSLELSPREKVTEELIQRLRKHKPAIVEELKREQTLQIELIGAWLHRIGEPEQDHCLVIDKCRNDPEALEYFLKHARGEFDHAK